MSIYQFSEKLITGEEKSLADYKNHVMLIVNTATQCGFTPQLRALQTLYDKYKDEQFVVLGFPCNQFGNQEPGTEAEINETCSVNFGVHFPLFQKVHVKGDHAHPLFRYLTTEQKGMFSSAIKWNFTKFLIDREGHVVQRFAPMTKPEKIETKIVELL